MGGSIHRGWTTEGSLESTASLPARDPDETLAEFVEQTPAAPRSADVVSAPVAIADGALGHATTVILAADSFTVVEVDRNEHGLDELPGSPRRGGRHHRPAAETRQ
jgi:hypothetical protein